jgi:hypothetical protein
MLEILSFLQLICSYEFDLKFLYIDGVRSKNTCDFSICFVSFVSSLTKSLHEKFICTQDSQPD